MLEVLGVIGPIILGIAGMFLGYIFQRAQLKRQQHEDERKEIYQKLNSFYGPFQQHLEKSRELYGLFTVSKEPEFRTLIALLEGKKFEKNDKILVEEILKIIGELENLILSQSGLIDDEELRLLFAKAGAHFRILQLAYKGDLSGDVERFKDYVYPRELNQKIEKRIQALQARLDQLNTLY